MSDDDIIDQDEVLRIARAVSARYAARCWWADRGDMEQEASLAILLASRTWDPEVGVPFEGYATRAAILHLRTYLWRQSSPVSGGLHDPRKHIAGIHRASIESPSIRPEKNPSRRDSAGVAFVPSQLRDHSPSPGELMDEERWRLIVRRRLRTITNATKDGDLAHEVLVRGREPSDVAAETGRNPYKTVELVRRKARIDAKLYKLWERGSGRG